MTLFRRIAGLGYLAIIVLFTVGAFALVGLAGYELWGVVAPDAGNTVTMRFDAALEAIAMLTIALASLELADTVVNEEFKREPQMSAAARVRRMLGRFFVVVVVSLAIEALVTVFHFAHEDPSNLIYAAAIAGAAAVLLIGWGYFIRMNREAD